jgi:hypothetical protein
MTMGGIANQKRPQSKHLSEAMGLGGGLFGGYFEICALKRTLSEPLSK